MAFLYCDFNYLEFIFHCWTIRSRAKILAHTVNCDIVELFWNPFILDNLCKPLTKSLKIMVFGKLECHPPLICMFYCTFSYVIDIVGYHSFVIIALEILFAALSHSSKFCYLFWIFLFDFFLHRVAYLLFFRSDTLFTFSSSTSTSHSSSRVWVD